jgi:hypothetical protein
LFRDPELLSRSVTTKGTQMSSKTISVLTVVLYSVALLGQQAHAAHAPAGSEFPAVMRQNVAAGKTRVGTKVEAKLW